MKAPKRAHVDQDSNVLSQALFRYLPYWPLFLLLLLLSLAGSWLYLRYTTPLYETNARLLIKDQKKGAMDTKALEELNVLSTKKIIENEIEVMRSRTLLNDVVKNLGLYAPVSVEGNLRQRAAYASSPVKIRVKDVDNITETEEVEFSYQSSNATVAINGRRYPLNQWVETPYGTLQFRANDKARKPYNGEKLFFTLVDPKEVASDIQSRLKVEATNKQSSILSLSLRDEVPQRGEDILNELLVAYNKATINDKNSLAVNTLSFVEERLKSVERDLDSIEKKTQQYKSRKGAIDISEQGRLFLQNVSANDQKLGDINMQLAVLNQVEDYVRSKNNGAGIVPSTLGVSDPILSQLVDKLYSAELEYESLKSTTAENNPAMLALQDKIQKVKPSILENIQSQRRSLSASKSNLAATNSSYSSVLQTMPETERELIDINRAQSIKNGIYSFLLQKREETALTHASTVSDSRIVDRAQSSLTPVSPKSKVVYLSAILIAIAGGIALITGRESLSRKVMFRHEIEALTDLPIIGEIVSEDSKTPIVIGEGKKTFVAEQFRRLRASLQFMGINSKRKRILVTSAISGEGKSFVATNLALSLALTGKRVVLLDCDLNNPSLNKKLGIGNGLSGVTEYLQDEAEADGIINRSGLHENLFFIPAGSLPRNPAELIMNGRIEDLLNYLDATFDYIVVDTAPVSPVTDAYMISPYCDATLFVVRHGYTPKVFVQRIDENNKINQLNNTAIVFNGVRPRGFGNKNYGYGYGYGYIYHDSKSQNKRLRKPAN
ncbi:MAG TPA: polysaccharide biosynthesis tyrosine autokinase [Flavisolibacter sp.]|nr:polysaccharide biosynthesis tyrosine autokinase [Flavisolibacter sp.]